MEKKHKVTDALQRPGAKNFVAGMPKMRNTADVIANKSYNLGYQQGQLIDGVQQFEKEKAQRDAEYAQAITQLFNLQAQNHADTLAAAVQLSQLAPQQPQQSAQDMATGGAMAALMGHATGQQQAMQPPAPTMPLAGMGAGAPPQAPMMQGA